jgi:hypothetical protein
LASESPGRPRRCALGPLPKTVTALELLKELEDKNNCSIQEDFRVGERVRQNLAKEYAKTREGLHVSDLVLCLRKSLYRKLKPVEPTIKEIGYYLDGARRHEALESMYGAVAEKEVVFEGVHCTLDLLDNGIPIEFKTTRAAKAISPHYIRQLVYYMLALRSSVGLLQVQRINHPRARDTQWNPFPAYGVCLTEQQRKAWLEDFRRRRDEFNGALQAKDPSLAPIYRGDGEWICRECTYRAECDKLEGRS